jgi:pyruvate/2-oxoglutarate dehydrogenase complex dihydrolipoamide acyltransferase (E2) component
MHTVTLPELGEGIQKAVVACWHIKEGAQVDADDDIVELVTDKASFNVPAGNSGTVQRIMVQEGQEAKIGQTLAIIAP